MPKQDVGDHQWRVLCCNVQYLNFGMQNLPHQTLRLFSSSHLAVASGFITVSAPVVAGDSFKDVMIHFNDTQLLTSYSYGNSNNINRKEDICIKEALFQFLSCVDRRIWLVMNTHMFLPQADISLGWTSPSIYISLYKCCIYKIDTRLILADCDLQQQHFKDLKWEQG